ncbi:N/A [soil metagenome]
MTHIIIPMSGTGERFKKAGYTKPKPLINVDNAPIIKYVVSMFDPSDKFTFICNQDHLAQTDLADVLKKLVPGGEIISIAAHKKGPVYAVSQCFDRLDDDEEVIVNYCDFYSYWNYEDFLATTRKRGAAGSVPSYRGFHPHMLGTDNYAFIKDTDLWLEAIQEKKPFTDDRMSEFASNGTYYFSRGEYVKKYFTRLMERDIQVNGEFYVSMIYNLMVEDGLPVSVYEVQHMLQWGTPRDLEEYQHWSNYFARLEQEQESTIPTQLTDTVLIPMAGRGARFSAVGYDLPKPLIPVSGKPMVVQACDNLPPANRYIFVALKEHLDHSKLEQTLRDEFENVSVVAIDEVTEGQASTCELGLVRATPPQAPDDQLLIGACDNGIIYDPQKWNALLNETSIDVAALSFRQHPASERNPQMYGWIKVDGNVSEFPKITGVSVKKAISDQPRNDHAIVGAFYFRKTSDFLNAFEMLKKENIRVNGEFYVDSMIEVAVRMGLTCVAFEVDDYICFGTPNDLKTFEYWQSFFHKCNWHPYSIEVDRNANEKDTELRQRVQMGTERP